MASYIGRREYRSAGDIEQQQRVLTQLLRGAPVAVPIVTPPAGDVPPAAWYVYPKGYTALLTLVEMERQYRELIAWRTALEAHEDPPPELMQAFGLLARAQARLQATFVWIVTHPGPGVPYALCHAMPWDVEDGMPPQWCFDLDPLDILRITAAHVEVNVLRLQSLPKLDDPKERGTGWATFFVNMAEASGDSPAWLMEAHPLSALMARSALISEQQQRRDAERKKQGSPPPGGVVHGG